MNQYVTGAAIKELRERKRMTQADLAGKLAVSDKAVSKWETGKGYPDITLLEPLAQVYQRSIQTLMQMKTYSDGSSVWPDVQYECGHYIKLFKDIADPKEMLKVRSALNEATREINAAEEEMPPSALIELMGDAPDVEAILATIPEDAYLPKEEPEAAPAEEAAEEAPADEPAAEE